MVSLRSLVSSTLLIWSSVSIGANVDSMPIFDSSIPVVDMSDFYSEDSTRHEHFMTVLKDALQRVGFFAVLDSSVDVASLNHGYDTAKQFFSLDRSLKLLRVNAEDSYPAFAIKNSNSF